MACGAAPTPSPRPYAITATASLTDRARWSGDETGAPRTRRCVALAAEKSCSVVYPPVSCSCSWSRRIVCRGQCRWATGGRRGARRVRAPAG